MAGCIRRIAFSGSARSIRPVELLMSAKITVRRLRSPPLALRARSTSSADGRAAEAAAGPSGALHLPQKWLLGRLIWPQAGQTASRGFPQASQNAFVALLS